MSQVRAKFQVASVKKSVNRDGSFTGTEIEMLPVYGEKGTENATWSRYTPSGSLKMYITNPTAEDAFRPGQEYYVDFTLAEQRQPEEV